MEYIAVLDLGTSKMLAMVASKSDRQTILATAQIDSGDSIRRGLIYKPTEAVSKIAELIRCLNQKLAQANLPALKQIYLGVGGQGLHTKTHSVEKNINGNLVDNKMLDLLCDECQADGDGSIELIEKIFPEYFLDGRTEPQPQGARCSTLEARFQLIWGHLSNFKAEVEKALAKENVELVDVLVAPVATAEQVLTQREKERGCALVELGAGITYLSIYKEGLLRHLTAIPLGGNIITKDVCSLDKTEAEAESLKINTGCAWANDETNELNTIIEARADEIVLNILRQIEISGYGPTLNAGFILTGGTSRLTDLDKLLEQHTDKPVRRVEENPEQSCARGLLQLGHENCASALPKPEQSTTSTSDKLLFDDEIAVNPQPKQPKSDKKKDPSGSLLVKLKKGAEKAAKGLFD
ncbi:MAG: pilus assembly protein PilM [Dysgonamonadaceae bacterium]|jgi:cell division protein FtsA|nr:pilus assembly protein PilM [Dysgonamonadaceae bacterium]